jgi:tryptophanyl-tRNA synthetase
MLFARAHSRAQNLIWGVQIKRYAFSGGQDSLDKHRELGANLDVDVPFNYLRFFLEDDDELEMVCTKLFAFS